MRILQLSHQGSSAPPVLLHALPFLHVHFFANFVACVLLFLLKVGEVGLKELVELGIGLHATAFDDVFLHPKHVFHVALPTCSSLQGRLKWYRGLFKHAFYCT